MSSWKLVEAEPEQQEQTMDKNKPYNGKHYIDWPTVVLDVT